MINRKTGQIILEIPKSGSRSLVQAAIDGHGKKVFACHGHHTLHQILNLMPTAAPKLGDKVMTVVAVVRDPEQRFVSQINEYMRIKQCKLDDAIDACLTQSHIMFKPQWEFLVGAGEFDNAIYPLEDCHHAHELVAGKDLRIAYHRNSGHDRRGVTAKQIFTHAGAVNAMDMFALDYSLYESAKHTLTQGKKEENNG